MTLMIASTNVLRTISRTDGFLKGGEVSGVIQHDPQRGHLRFQLPRVGFGLRTQFYDGSEVQHRTVLHTLIVYPDKGSFQMVWHSQLPCHHKVNKLKTTSVFSKRKNQCLGIWRSRLAYGPQRVSD